MHTQETVSAKLDVWLGRHPEREMTAEEAERQNRAPSPMVSEAIPQSVTNSPKPLSRIPPPSIRLTDSKPPPPALSASLGSETSSLDLGFEVKNASAATSSVAKAIMINKIENGRPSAAQANLETSAHDASAAEPPKDEMCVPQRIEQQTELQTTKGQSSLPALTYSSSFPATTPSDSIASTSKTSEQPRTPLTAMASSPILDPSLATTVPLKIIPKTRSGTNVQKVRKPLSPGGEQPWGQAWLEITEALIRCALLSRAVTHFHLLIENVFAATRALLSNKNRKEQGSSKMAFFLISGQKSTLPCCATVLYRISRKTFS